MVPPTRITLRRKAPRTRRIIRRAGRTARTEARKAIPLRTRKTREQKKRITITAAHRKEKLPAAQTIAVMIRMGRR
ncbi:MAG: hypothetical protein HFG58_07215 [Lachnospiraceae bacterium]|nr:hypothetical protein [Lachnospiraceae bacterium]